MNDEKVKVLLCEDDENLGMLLREYLQAKGYDTDLLPDGEAGYKAFMKNTYDVCVFDVMMPKKDGFTLAQEIRAINTDVPILFLTAKNLKEDILEGFKIGGDDYITKPFSMEELLFLIEAILRRIKGKKVKEMAKIIKSKGVVTYEVEVKRKDYEVYNKKYELGMSTYSDYLDRLNALDLAAREYEKAKNELASFTYKIKYMN